MKAKKVLKVIGIVLVVLILLVLIHTIRNFTIIRGLQKKFEQYSASGDFNVRTHSLQDGTTIDIDYYKKDEKEAMIMNRTKEGQTSKISSYNNGSRIDTFYDTKDSKVAKLNSNTSINMSISNGIETDSNFQTFILCMISSVKKVKVNQIECYLIKNFKSPASLNGASKNEIYVEKNTGLLTKSVLNDQVMNREYEFNNVDDSTFIEPNIREYTLQE